MTLKIDFNNPRILRGYLEEALPQINLVDDGRIMVGSAGGLGYNLFKDNYRVFPLDLRVGNKRDIEAVTDYFRVLNAYLEDAEQRAQRYDFGLVCEKDKMLAAGLADSDFIYSAYIGGATIQSLDRLEKFLYMVKENKEPLDEKYQALLESANKVKAKK